MENLSISQIGQNTWNNVGIENVVNVGIGIENGIVPVDGKLQQHGSILQIFIDGKLGIDGFEISTPQKPKIGHS